MNFDLNLIEFIFVFSFLTLFLGFDGNGGDD